MRREVVLSFLLGLAATPSAHAACSGAKTTTFGSVSVRSLPNRVFFRTSGLELDFDGSPIAYGVKDQGEENICAGLAPNSGPCRGKYRGTCYPVCQQTFAAWSRSHGTPETIGKTMCSNGLGGSGCSVPDVQLQDAPHDDYFVSETSLKVSPETDPPVAHWTAKQGAQLDPAKIRYLVAPPGLARLGVHYGDVGVAFNAKGGDAVTFIVGDGGGLGEGSVSLLAALRPDSPPRLAAKTSALGEPVMRYTQGVSGDFRFVIFPATVSLSAGGARMTKASASQLPDWIEATAQDALKARSSRAEVLDCAR